MTAAVHWRERQKETRVIVTVSGDRRNRKRGTVFVVNLAEWVLSRPTRGGKKKTHTKTKDEKKREKKQKHFVLRWLWPSTDEREKETRVKTIAAVHRRERQEETRVTWLHPSTGETGGGRGGEQTWFIETSAVRWPERKKRRGLQMIAAVRWRERQKETQVIVTVSKHQRDRKRDTLYNEFSRALTREKKKLIRVTMNAAVHRRWKAEAVCVIMNVTERCGKRETT